ncbi:MAG: phosphoribosylformylglycinamidine synthase subunit PurL [Chloroflexia bacterium]|nr:phosphoribosylformylglycinamidine synthase subunit PurL [Chloroflexia bacterium]
MSPAELTAPAVASHDDGSAPWREVALSDEEYALIVDLLGRTPLPVELGMFGAMWSEHCGYKHSRPHFHLLPTEAPWVVQGPGENAGAVDLGDGLAAVFKVESHNHPSAVEPFEGAATGVGGIVRDIFTMGARPVAILDSLRFGPLTESRNRYLFENVVAGIGGYGNCLGIPTVGGEVAFDPSYSGNPLVNAMCVGIVARDDLMRARATGTGNLIVLIGAATGRDGLHGATFASVSDPEASHRGVVQVGNPFLEKLLMEACLELLRGDDVVAMQDLGAAGLTSSLVECASRGDVGAEIDVGLVPRRETGMNAYEVMLSESQERMLLVIRPEGVERVRETVERWSLHATVIGRVTDDGVVRVRDGADTVVAVPAALFTDACPTYTPDAVESPAASQRRAVDVDAVVAAATAAETVPGTLLRLLASPNIGSREPVWSRYDHTIQTSTVVPPGAGDAAVIRLRGTGRALAVSLDCNARLCYLDPYEGAMQAVAEATRNVSVVGGRPLGVTNCLNFGNPRLPAGAFQLREAVRGMADACRALGVPVVSGNVSLYNQTGDEAVMPTPTIGVVGVLDDVRRHATMRWEADDLVFLIGSDRVGFGGSEVAALAGPVAGTPVPIDLGLEARVQGAVRALVERGLVRTAHDRGLGGLAVALAEMAFASDIGITAGPGTDDGQDETLAWFGEGPSGVVIALPTGRSEAVLASLDADDIPVRLLGTAGGERWSVDGSSLDLARARAAWLGALVAGSERPVTRDADATVDGPS